MKRCYSRGFYTFSKILTVCYTHLGLPIYFVLFFLQLNIEDVYLSYLPLAHIFDRVIEECFISHGARIGFWRGVSDYFVMIFQSDYGNVMIYFILGRWLLKLFAGCLFRMSSYCLRILEF